MTKVSQGKLLAEMFRGAWRPSVPALSWDADELRYLTRHLLEAGAAGLAWRKLKSSPLFRTTSARELRDAYRFDSIRGTQAEIGISRLVRFLGKQGIQPILFKGWSVARHYADTTYRPYGDTDIAVAPEQMAEVLALLDEAREPFGVVDLHEGMPDLPDRTWDDILVRSRLVALNGTAIRVLGPEDELRLLCVHMIRHGISRPVWLCDLAAALEARPADFNWDYCLQGNRVLTRWVLALLALARDLLGARIDEPRVEKLIGRLPGWLIDAVLWRWGAGHEVKPYVEYLKHPTEAAEVISFRYLNPIKSAYRMGAFPQRRLHVALIQAACFLYKDLPVYIENWLKRPESQNRINIHEQLRSLPYAPCRHADAA